MEYASLTLANEIATRLTAEHKKNPRAFYARAAKQNAKQDRALAAAKSARLATGGITEND